MTTKSKIVATIIGTVLILTLMYFPLAYNNCDTCSYQAFKILNPVVDIQICCGLVDGQDYDHAWIRVNEFNIETTTLNLFKAEIVDYNNPYFISDDIEQIQIELFHNHKRGKSL